MEPLAPPLTLLQFEGVAIAALAVLFAAVWLRSREPGTPLLALGFAVTALWYLYADNIAYAGRNIDTAQQRIWSSLVLLGVILVSSGVVQYLGAPRVWRRAFLAAFWLPPVLFLVAISLTPEIPRRVFHIGAMLPYLGTALLAFRRARQQPGDGHVLLGIALLAAASTPYVLLAAGMPAVQLKYLAGAAVVLFGMALLAISLLRRQRMLDAEVHRRARAEEQLRDANVHLEARVQERTAQLQELIGGLEAFNRSVSHDLRGPLGGMAVLARSAADALARGDGALAQRSLPMIAKQCEASAGLVSTMLDLARLGNLQIRREPVNLSELAQAAFEEVKLGSLSGVCPELHCAPIPALLSDPRLLRPVLVNLMANAVKFSRESPRPRIDVVPTVSGRDLTVCVRDNGVGFTPEVAERIFEPFFRAHGARFDGSGLGLTIVRRAVLALGGRAWAESRPQGGAAFCFTLPDSVIADGPQSAGGAAGPGRVASEPA